MFPSHRLPLVPLAGLPSDPAFHPDLHPRGCGETHHPDGQEPAPAAVRPAQLRVHLPHPRQHHPRHRPALQQHQHPVPEHLGECDGSCPRRGPWLWAAPSCLPHDHPGSCMGSFALSWAGYRGFCCLWGVRRAPTSPSCVGRLLGVVPDRINAEVTRL